MLDSWEFWAPTLTSSAIIGIAGAIISPWYRGWIEKGIQFDFDKRLEELRATFRNEERRLSAELQTQETELAAIRTGALQQMSARRTALDNRKLEAIEKLWAAVVAMSPARVAIEFTSVLQLDKILGEDFLGSEDKKQLGEMLWQSTGIEKLVSGESRKGQLERPFVSPLTWALFSAYSAAIMYPVAQISVLRTGLDGKVLQESEIALKPIREALPEWSKVIDKFGLSALKQLVEALEQKLLEQLRQDLEGDDGSAETVQQAARILKAADAASQALKPSPEIPDDLQVKMDHLQS